MGDRSSVVSVPLPDGWRRRFDADLRSNPDARRLWHFVLPESGADGLKKIAMLHVRPPRILRTERKKRGAKKMSGLRQQARRGTPAARESIRQQLARARRAFGTRRMGLKSEWALLVVISEYLAYRGLVPTYPELAAIVQAASAAWGDRYKEPVDIDTLAHNLRNFRKNSPELLSLVALEKSVRYVERSTQLN